ncbi:hypothetical protein LMG7974_00005 [Campylobacter majalis]|uniref:beta-lactamase n=1 Tax=Campylobacter majalis TaxID=2790656 RepID=A0ABN7K6Z9_9BACT|nr:tetratricopeptide repeat protein [Campylobacter majalis]CAD7286630.1 hypothetical protein LMG7974_00005 [Campylobacter majalis]
MKKLCFICIFLLSLCADDKIYKDAVDAYNSGDCKKAVKLYDELVKQEHFEAIFNYAWMNEKGICVEQDYKKARELYKVSINADKINTKRLSMYRLGLLLITARGSDDVSHDNIQKAIKLWQQSDYLGYAQASLSLGMLYYQGAAIAKDENLAYDYFDKACNGGVKEACNILANIKVQ